MNHHLLLSILERVLREADLQEFSSLGGGSITGYISHEPEPYVITKPRKKRKKLK